MSNRRVIPFRLVECKYIVSVLMESRPRNRSNLLCAGKRSRFLSLSLSLSLARAVPRAAARRNFRG